MIEYDLNTDVVKIYNCASSNEINEVNRQLAVKNSKVIVILDSDIDPIAGQINSLEILKHLPICTKLQVLVKGNNPLSDIKKLEFINFLIYLKLNGNVKKTISLEPILKFKNSIRYLSIEWASRKNVEAIINQLEMIEKLQISTIDFADLTMNRKVKCLRVLKSAEDVLKINAIFPCLELLDLKSCPSITDVSTMILPDTLKHIVLNYMSSLKSFPIFQNCRNSINSIKIIDAPNLEDVSNLIYYEKLESLTITRIKKLKGVDFQFMEKLSNLKTVYLDFISEQDDYYVKELCNKRLIRFEFSKIDEVYFEQI